MDSNSNSKSKIGVLLVGHGSRLPYGEEVINGLAEIYRQQADYPVMVGFMNMNKPSIPKPLMNSLETVLKKLLSLQYSWPMEYTPNRTYHIFWDWTMVTKGHGHGHDHSHQDEEDEEIQFEGEIIYTEPLGSDPRLVEILKDRVNNSLN